MTTSEGKLLFRFLLVTAFAYFFALMVRITIQYVPIRMDIAFLLVKQEEIKLTYYQIAFFTHVFTSIFVLLFGAFQFSAYIRKKYRQVHLFLGKMYILLILLFSAPAGLVMGYHGNGGPIAKTAFLLLGSLWIIFTAQAYQYARAQNWQLHKNYMYRSYSLTLSAISLRLFKWIIVANFDLAPMDAYRIVSWAGWVVNLVIAELLISQNFLSRRAVPF
jgi:Predicted membrane protein (DUF2306)